MLLSTFILVSVNGEHDSLQQCVNLGHRNKSTKVRNMPGFGLKEEEQVSVFLRLLVIREEALL